MSHGGRTPHEWHSSANSNMSLAYSSQVKAIQQMDMSRKAHKDALNENLATYSDLNSTLESKVKSSYRLIEKLNKRVSSVESSIDSMKQSHEHLQKALIAKEPPLALCLWRMELREKRPLREHVRDHVELALEDERTVLLDTQKKLSDAIKMSMKMIDMLEDKKDELKRDIDQKSQALNVDELCLRTTHRSWHSHLSPRSATPGSSRSFHSSRPASGLSTTLPSPVSARSGRSGFNGEACFQESNRNEMSRHQEARRLHNSAQGREEASAGLRADNAKLITRCEKIALQAAAKTERALQERINEIQEMRRRIEGEARATRKKQEHTRTTIAETKSQISSLMEPMQLCSTQSSWRKQRACDEQIKDPVESSLEQQKRQLMLTTEELRNHRKLEKSILTELQEHTERLKEDLKDKTAALNIDMHCLTQQHESASPMFSDPNARARYAKLMKRERAATRLPSAR